MNRIKQKEREVKMAAGGAARLFASLTAEISQSWLSPERIREIDWSLLREEDIQAIRELMDLADYKCSKIN